MKLRDLITAKKTANRWIKYLQRRLFEHHQELTIKAIGMKESHELEHVIYAHRFLATSEIETLLLEALPR